MNLESTAPSTTSPVRQSETVQTSAATISSDFDTFLAIMDDEGNIIEQNDDVSENASNSKLEVTIPNQGNYNLIVNSYEKGGKGAYILTISR